MMNLTDKKETQIKHLIFHNFMEIVETFPQYNISQHLLFILRKKGDKQEVYDWKDDKLLKKFESYKDELETELANFIPEED